MFKFERLVVWQKAVDLYAGFAQEVTPSSWRTRKRRLLTCAAYL